MFPSFTSYSTPLFILYLWGIIFSILLFRRYFQKGNISDLLLACVIVLHTYERTTYTIGFMGWYDTFKNTKINYFLISGQLLLGPFIYYYTRSITEAYFKVKKTDMIHMVPMVVLVLFRLSIYVYDVNQSGFNEVQNGQLFSSQAVNYIGIFTRIITEFSLGIYLVFSIQKYWNYKNKIRELFSNLYQLELRWLRNFLAIFTFLFLVMLILMEIDDSITNLHYTDYWWGHLAAALSLIYLGIYGYMFDVNKLRDVNIKAGHKELPQDQHTEPELDDTIKESQLQLQDYMLKEKPYLNNKITLAELAKGIGFHTNELSHIINKAEGMNFNDYVNSHRVEAVKDAIKSGKADQYTLLTIAFESGFNSKATFNRTFKKFTQQSPSEFLKNNKTTNN